jgi:apyrase
VKLPVQRPPLLHSELLQRRHASLSFEEAKTMYPTLIDYDDVPYVCMDLSYQYTLLVDGFD